MKVAVIMSVYNAERYLAISIESLMSQTFREFDIVVIDDHSTDRSSAILEKLSERDSRIRVLRNSENIGLTRSLNRALDVVNAPYIARMDADDICEPSRLQEQVSYLESHPDIDILGTAAVDIDENGTPLRVRNVPLSDTEVRRMMVTVNPLVHPSVMMRREILDRVGGYDERFRTSQDYDLWFRAAAAGARFANLQAPLLRYRQDESYGARKSFRYRWNEVKIRARGYRLNGVPPIGWIRLLLPLTMAAIPQSLYGLVKRMDPRSQKG